MDTALLCPFSAGTLTWLAQDGAATLTVCVRGTFTLVQGREAVLADAQEPVTGDRHHDDDPRASLHAQSDFVPYKPRADVILVGSAFAPEQTPVEALIARLTLGPLDKAIGVIGDRAWVPGPDGLEPGPPRPFRSLPLRAERAERAPDNPRGFDLARAPEAGKLALPNLEAVDDAPGAARTLGFGPIPADAPTRRGLLGEGGWAWASGGGGPVPPGFDFAFYNAAPRDQQLDLLRVRDALVLENLHREHARLRVGLPTVRPRAFLVSRDAERATEVALRCDTLWIDTDRAVLALSWRGLIGLRTAETTGLDMLVVVAESKGRELRWKQIQKMLLSGSSVSLDEDSVGDTYAMHPLGQRHDHVSTPPPPRPSPPAPAIWDELSSSALLEMEITMTDAPPSLPAPAALDEDTLNDDAITGATRRR